jgi:hypothetical protein
MSTHRVDTTTYDETRQELNGTNEAMHITTLRTRQGYNDMYTSKWKGSRTITLPHPRPLLPYPGHHHPLPSLPSPLSHHH